MKKIGLILIFFILPLISNAAIIRTDKTATINQEEVLSENVYLVGGEPTISGTVNSDVFGVGRSVNITGNVNGDVLISGGNLNIKGNVNGDVRVLGANVNVENNISGDLVVIGSTITLNENTKVSGDIILIGGNVSLKNTSDKHIRVVSGSTFVYGKILNTANITSEKIHLLKDSEVLGELSYFSPRQAIIEEGAKVNGSVSFNKVDSIRENGIAKHAIVSFLNFWMLFRFITTLILTFILVYVFKIFSQNTALQSVKSFWKSFLIGVMTFIFVPVIITILLISLILLPVAILLGMVYAGIFIISNAIAGIALGAFLKKIFMKKNVLEVSFHTATIGVIVLTVLQFVPLVGDVTRYVFITSAFGSVWIYLYDKVRWGNFR
ncbi:MAG: hypothetical protein RLY43_1577 [Bacteroidota bacterium]